VNVAMRREEVVHDNEVNLLPMRQLDAMQSVKPRDERMRVLLDVLVVVLEDGAEELVLAVPDGLDDEAVVAGEVEERAALAGGAEFGEDVFGGEGDEVVRGVEVKVLPKLAEDPGGVVFELEVVLDRRSKLVTDAVKRRTGELE
jgi:hypothetical protein